MTVQERLARLEERQAAMAEDIKEIKVGINGPLNGRSIRERLHTLETSDSAALAAAAAVDAAKRIRRDTWSFWSKVIVMTSSATSAILSLVAVFHSVSS